jgi:hypothetical protein
MAHISCLSPPAFYPAPRIVVPPLKGLQIHWAKFPLSQRILDARLESPLLYFLPYFQPELDQDDSSIHDVLFDLWTELEKRPVLLFRAEAHDVLETCAVVPTSVKNNNFSRGWKMLHVALHIHL